MQEKIRAIFKEQCRACRSKLVLCRYCYHTIELDQYKLDIAYIEDVCHSTKQQRHPSGGTSSEYVKSTTLIEALAWLLNQSITLEDTLKILKFKNTYNI